MCLRTGVSSVCFGKSTSFQILMCTEVSHELAVKVSSLQMSLQTGESLYDLGR